MADPTAPIPAPRTRAEARGTTRRPRPAQSARASRPPAGAPTTRREFRAAMAPPERSLAGRVVTPALVTALLAVGSASALVGLPGTVASGTPASLVAHGSVGVATPGTSFTQSAQQPGLVEPAAAMIGTRGQVGASRGSMDRLTLAWGTAALAQSREAMNARGESVQNSLNAGLAVTAVGKEQVRDVAASRAFHEPVLAARQTSGFGWRWGRMHNGLDFGADYGTPLYAVGQGTVTTAGWNSGLGYHVKITLVSGEVIVYGHLSRIQVLVGDAVVAGTPLGEVGNSGRSTGAHLHLEVRVDGAPIDPESWLRAQRS